jgi:hypothetical protein
VDIRLALAAAAVPMLTAGVILAASRSARALGTATPEERGSTGEATVAADSAR